MKKIIVSLLITAAICLISGCDETSGNSRINNSDLQSTEIEKSNTAAVTEASSDNTKETTELKPVSTIENIHTDFIKTAIKQAPDELPFMTELPTMRSIADEIIPLKPNNKPPQTEHESATETVSKQKSTKALTEKEKSASKTTVTEHPSEKEQ